MNMEIRLLTYLHKINRDYLISILVPFEGCRFLSNADNDIICIKIHGSNTKKWGCHGNGS